MSKISRQEVYGAFEAERLYQISEGKSDEQSLAEWMDTIDYYLSEARQGDYYRPDSRALDNLRKVGALIVAALEQYGVPPREAFHAPEEWVSVEESLPALNMTVLVYIPIRDGDEYLVAWRFMNYDKEEMWGSHGGHIYGGITHWRALSDGPQEQEAK